MFVHMRVETSEQHESVAESLKTISAPLALKAVKDTWEHLLLPPPPSGRIDIWARVLSPGPLMADKAGATGNTIHADEQPARGEGEGVVGGKRAVWRAVEDESSCPLDHSS